MNVLKENKDKVTIEFTKFDFNNIRNFFLENKTCVDATDRDQYESIKKLVYLPNVDLGLFENIETFLNYKNNEI